LTGYTAIIGTVVYAKYLSMQFVPRNNLSRADLSLLARHENPW
jgi:hypothetical protein